MTALTKYERLECPGLWRATPAAQRREVVVGFREATLVLSDPRTEDAISHWSLPAVVRSNPGTMPAVFSPGEDGSETLEIDDAEMVTALETVARALERRRPHPGRLRFWLTLGAVAVLAAGVVFWVPGALVRQTAQLLPEPTRAQIARLVLADLARLTGSPCSDRAGLTAADALSERLFAAPGRIVILREGLTRAALLPDGRVILPRKLVEVPPDAETAAGHAVLAAVGGVEADPILPLLSHAGLMATVRLLTTGLLPPDAVQGYGEVLIAATPALPDRQRLLLAFVGAELSTRALADDLAQPDLAAEDPFAGQSPRPVLDDGDWIGLQAICAAG